MMRTSAELKVPATVATDNATCTTCTGSRRGSVKGEWDREVVDNIKYLEFETSPPPLPQCAHKPSFPHSLRLA